MSITLVVGAMSWPLATTVLWCAADPVQPLGTAPSTPPPDSDAPPMKESPMEEPLVDGPVAESPVEESPVDLTDDGQLVGAACASSWQQCAGKNYDGRQNCCQEGLECVFSNPWYSQCLPKADVMPSTATDAPDDIPPEEPESPPEPQPVPMPESELDGMSDCPTVWKQCGGERFDGVQNCCSEGSVCTFQSKWYSQCRPGVCIPGFHG